MGLLNDLMFEGIDARQSGHTGYWARWPSPPKVPQITVEERAARLAAARAPAPAGESRKAFTDRAVVTLGSWYAGLVVGEEAARVASIQLFPDYIDADGVLHADPVDKATIARVQAEFEASGSGSIHAWLRDLLALPHRPAPLALAGSAYGQVFSFRR